MPSRFTQKIQLGLETTPGTEVNATTIWRGRGMISDDREVRFVNEHVGLLVPTNRTYTPRVLGSLDMDDVEATYEQLPYILACGIKNVTTGASDGSGSGKIYTYDFPTGATSHTIKTATIECGDALQEEQMLYAFVTEFKLTGGAGESVRVSAKWNGRQVETGTFTSGLSPQSVDEILFQRGKLYIDDAGGTIGTTLKSNTFKSFTLNVRTGWKPVFTGDGNLYFSTIAFADPEVTLDMTFLHDATALGIKSDWRTENGQLIRLKFEGPALTTPGTTYSYKALIIDLAGKWEKIEKIGEQDNLNVITGKFRCALDQSANLFATFVVVNEVSAL